jgi:hypothetical protein
MHCPIGRRVPNLSTTGRAWKTEHGGVSHAMTTSLAAFSPSLLAGAENRATPLTERVLRCVKLGSGTCV